MVGAFVPLWGVLAAATAALRAFSVSISATSTIATVDALRAWAAAGLGSVTTVTPLTDLSAAVNDRAHPGHWAPVRINVYVRPPPGAAVTVRVVSQPALGAAIAALLRASIWASRSARS